MDDGFVERSMLETHINHIMWVLRIQLQANDIVCTDRDKQTGDVSEFLMYYIHLKVIILRSSLDHRFIVLHCNNIYKYVPIIYAYYLSFCTVVYYFSHG